MCLVSCVKLTDLVFRLCAVYREAFTLNNETGKNIRLIVVLLKDESRLNHLVVVRATEFLWIQNVSCSQ